VALVYFLVSIGSLLGVTLIPEKLIVPLSTPAKVGIIPKGVCCMAILGNATGAVIGTGVASYPAISTVS
jgi:hypothetical protein